MSAATTTKKKKKLSMRRAPPALLLLGIVASFVPSFLTVTPTNAQSVGNDTSSASSQEPLSPCARCQNGDCDSGIKFCGAYTLTKISNKTNLCCCGEHDVCHVDLYCKCRNTTGDAELSMGMSKWVWIGLLAALVFVLVGAIARCLSVRGRGRQQQQQQQYGICN